MKEPLENMVNRLKGLMKAPATKENLAKYATPGKKKALEHKKSHYHGKEIKFEKGVPNTWKHKGPKRPQDEDDFRQDQ